MKVARDNGEVWVLRVAYILSHLESGRAWTLFPKLLLLQKEETPGFSAVWKPLQARTF